jgi:hypothetical protein
MKRILLLIGISIIFLSSCDKKSMSPYPEFPKTSWDMNMSEVLDVYNITEKDTVRYEDNNFLEIKDYKLFGEKSSKIHFYFADIKGENPKLCAIEVIYPEDSDMEIILKNMKKIYGDQVSEYSIFSYFTPFEATLSENKCVETDHLKLWASEKSILDWIPKNEIKQYREIWAKYQTPIAVDKNWDIFLDRGKMVSIAWTDNNEIPVMMRQDDQKNKLYFEAINLNVYNGIKNELSDKQ